MKSGRARRPADRLAKAALTPRLRAQSIPGTRGPFSSKFAAVTYQKTIANSNYNALQVNLHRSSGPLEVMVGYTYSKSLDESSSLAEAVNPIDPRLSGALSAFDMRNNFVASYKYRLPVGKLLRRQDGWTDGWAISGLTRFTTGFPVTLYNNTDRSLLGTIPNGINNNGVDTPNFTAGNLDIHTNPRNEKSAFNTSLFTLPALGEVGNAPRRFFAGPGIDNFDMALEKNVRLSESQIPRIPAGSVQPLQPCAVLRASGRERQHQQRKFRAGGVGGASQTGPVGCQVRLLSKLEP